MPKAIRGSRISWLSIPTRMLRGITTIFRISWKVIDNPSPKVITASVTGRKMSEKAVVFIGQMAC
jgi:hypothetical protein